MRILFLWVFVCCQAQAADYVVDEPANLGDVLGAAQAGDTVYLPNKVFRGDSYRVPDGVIVAGRDHTLIQSSDDYALFAQDGSENVTFAGMAVEIKNGSFLRGSDAKNILVDSVRIKGDILSDDTAYTAIIFENTSGLTVTNTVITETYGGIYANNSKNTKIIGNHLYKVTFGNVVVSGQHIEISDNVIEHPGLKPKLRPDPNGDAITLGLVENISIKGNTIKNGGCYGIWGHTPGSQNIIIKGNYIANGITAAINLQHAENVLVENNTLENNAGPGVSFYPVTNGTLKENVFRGDHFRIFSESKNISLIGNTFDLPAAKAVLHSISFVDGEMFGNRFSFSAIPIPAQ